MSFISLHLCMYNHTELSPLALISRVYNVALLTHLTFALALKTWRSR